MRKGIYRIIFIGVLTALITSLSAAEPLEVKKDNFETPGSTGDVEINTGFQPDLIVFRITSTNPEFNASESYENNADAEDFGLGHGFADCSTGSCDEVAQSDGSGSDSTNGHVSGAIDTHSIYQVITDNSGDGFEGSIKGTVSSTSSTGFTVTFDETFEQQNVVYTAYKFPQGTEVDVGHFRTPDSESLETVSTGFKPNFVHTVTSPQINQMGDFTETGGAGSNHGWSLGWAAKEDDESIDQATLGITQYSNDPDSHVASSNKTEIIHTLWKDDSGPINGRLQAELSRFTNSGFELNYTNVNPYTQDGNRFLVTYMAVKTSAVPEVGIETSPTSTGTQYIETARKLENLNFISSNTVSSVSSEFFSGNNNNDNHWGWMFGGGNITRSMQRALGFSSHSASVNGHSSASSNISAIRLLFTDENGGILGEDTAHISKLNKTGFELDWTDITTTSNNNVRHDRSTFVYNGFSQPPKKKSKYLRTFKDGVPRSFAANNTKITLETEGEFDEIPSITITDSNNSRKVDSAEMTNISGVFQYNFTLNGAQGWYDVSVNDELWDKSIYQSETWQNNYTDAEGDKFSFRKKLEVSEPGTSDRWFEPVDENISFEYGPAPETVRVVAYNGSRNIEIPSQIYNKNLASGDLQSSNIVFFSSISSSETRDYFVMSGNQAGEKNYTDLVRTSTSSSYSIETDRYKSIFKTENGGLLTDVKNKVGTNQSLVGTEPLDRYPEFGVGINSIATREEDNPVFSSIEGSLYSKFEFEGNASQDSSKPYKIVCEAYGKTSYFFCEKNQTTETAESVSDFYVNGLFFNDGLNDRFAYLNSSNQNETVTVQNGDSTDISGLDSQMNWLAFYNQRTGDGMAEIFLNRSYPVNESSSIEFQDNQENDFYRSKIIESASVPAGTSFYSRTARLVFKGIRESKYVNETYNQLKNPLQITENTGTTRDTVPPNYTDSGNISSNDSSQVKVFAKWQDDSLLDYAEINITGNGVDGNNTEIYYNDSYNIREDGFTNASYVNVTVPGSDFEAGEIRANFTVFDISGKSNSTEIKFNLSDTTPPEFGNITTEPSTEALLDPGAEINVTANITDYSNVSEANLSYRSFNSSSSKWSGYNEVEMGRISGEGFTNVYEANFTAQKEAVYSYFVESIDINGLRSNSTEKNLSVFNDSTWSLEQSLEDVTDTYDENATSGNITINNTGDYTTSLTIDSNFPERTWVNGSKTPYETKSLSPGQETFLQVNTTTRASSEPEGIDNFTLSISNSSLEPTERNKSIIVTTSTGGPFLDPSFELYDPQVTQGDQDIEIEISVTNRGNETANNTDLALDLPQGWSAAGNNKTVSNKTNLSAENTKTFNTFVDVAEDAETGNLQLTVNANGSDAELKSSSVNVKVNQQEQESESSDSGSGGGSSGGSSGGGGISLPENNVERESLQIETSSELTMIRGENNTFEFQVSNPFSAGLEDVDISASGFLAPHISVEPEYIESIPANSSSTVKVRIIAPRYLTIGVHRLNFSINGVKNTTEVRDSGDFTVRTGSFVRLNATKEFRITVHEFSRQNATNYLNDSKRLLARMEENGVASREVRKMVRNAEREFENNNYGPTRDSYQEIRDRWQSYQQTSQDIENLKDNIKSAENRGIEVDRSSRLVALAEQALERGDITGAATRSVEARNIYQLQTKGAFNLVYFVRNNIYRFIAGLIALIILTGIGYFKIRLTWISRKISNLEAREQAVKDQIRELQKQTLAGDKLSIGAYEERMEDHREEIADIVQKRISLESQKAALLNLGNSKKRLEDERSKLIGMMEQSQSNYYDDETISKNIYEKKIDSLYERLSEVESSLSEKIVDERTKGVGIW